MARINQNTPSSGKRILLIDDQEDYRESTIILLKREGHTVIGVSSGEEGLKIMKTESFDLLLVDYYMPGGMSGEDFIRQLREFNPYIQIILQTGYSGEHPPREMLKQLDIQGYHDKADGPDKLLLWVDVGLKVAFTVQLLSRSKLGLQYILNVTPDLHKLQQLHDLFQGILYQISGLIGIVNSFMMS
jgi:two-component system, cell cycle response regulator